MKQRAVHPFWLRWLYSIFSAWYDEHEQARAWSTRRCPCCGTPVSSDAARYCAMCGQCLLVEARVTDSLPIARLHSGELLRAYRDREGHRAGVSTTEHRAYVRTPENHQ